jgi:hypothetical protein
MAAQSGRQYIGNLRPVSPLGSDHDIFAAAGKSEGLLKFSISADLSKLTCQGALIDLIDGVGGLKVVHRDEHGNDGGPAEVHESINATAAGNLPPASVAGSSSPIHSELDPDVASKYMDFIFRCLLLNRKDRYLNYGDALPPGNSHQEFQAFWLAAMQTPSAVHPLFLDWFERNRTLHIESYSLQQICKSSRQLQSSTKVDLMDIMTNEPGFLSRFRDTTEYMTRRLMITNEAHMGMVLCWARKGD